MASLLFPAPAGMNRMLASALIESATVPRASGDEPNRRQMLRSCVPLFPASAGMNRVGGSFHLTNRPVPRASGDEPVAYCCAW